MMVLCIASLAIALLTAGAASQESGWITVGQVNASMCAWYNPRASVIRDSFYIDGGYLWWLPGLYDGSYGGPTQDGNPFGIVYSLNFSSPFNISSNFSDIFSKQHKGPNDQSAAAFGPQYYDGFMFSNDEDWLAYGGLLAITDSDPSPPLSTTIEGYQAYTDDTTKRFIAGFYEESLPSEMTRYVAYGGGVSIPVQNQGFYFGGLRAEDYGEIYYPSGNDSVDANELSNTLISVDMTTQGSEKWANMTIPSSIPGRASSELVWIPVANSGALIAIGGVILPEYENSTMSDTPTQDVESNITSSGFMETVAVYDIENKTWYLQNTSGTIPPATAEGCTVVASSNDASSHNIYWYGGFNGVDSSLPFYDDVYVLSIPSFIWIKVYTGNSSHGRAGHRCAKPYPDQMFVLGGYPSQPGDQQACLEGGILQVFNLSSAQWLESYNPDVWTEYSVPSSVLEKIGGSGTGGATSTSPVAWANESLANLFSLSYSQSQNIKNWYPYPLVQSTPSNTTAPSTTTTTQHSGGLPSWVAPVLGVVLGLMAITAVVVVFLLWRRRRYLRNQQSETGATDLNRYRIMSWVRGMPTTDTDTKAATVTTDENFNDAEALERNLVIAHETEGTQLHEMMDTSRPQELLDTGLTYANMSATPSGASRMTHASRRFPRSSGTPRPESPSLGNILPSRTKSGVSSVGSRHQHQVSEVGSVDSTSTGQSAALRTPEMAQSQTFFSPVSPPTPHNGQEATDYVNNGRDHGTSIPLLGKDNRKSNFEEDLNEQ